MLPIMANTYTSLHCQVVLLNDNASLTRRGRVLGKLVQGIIPWLASEHRSAMQSCITKLQIGEQPWTESFLH